MAKLIKITFFTILITLCCASIVTHQLWPSRPSLDMLDRLSQGKLHIDLFAITTPREHFVFDNKNTIEYLTDVLKKRRPRDPSSPSTICSLEFCVYVDGKPFEFQLWCDRECKCYKLGYYYHSLLGKEVEMPYEIDFVGPMPQEIEMFLKQLKATIKIEFPS